MTDNVKKFYPKAAAKNPDNVLEQAIGEFESIFMIGKDKNGQLDVRASTNMSDIEVLWLIESFKHALFSGAYRADD